MTPDIELQLQVIIKSLKDNVAPAIAKDNQLAQEQMHLSVAALQFTLEHLPFVHAYLQMDIENTIQLATRLSNLCGNPEWQKKLTDAIATANWALSNPKKGFTELQQDSRALRDVVCDVIRQASDGDNALKIHELVLNQTAASLKMGRAWNKPNGFEPDPDSVPSLETLFS